MPNEVALSHMEGKRKVRFRASKNCEHCRDPHPLGYGSLLTSENRPLLHLLISCLDKGDRPMTYITYTYTGRAIK